MGHNIQREGRGVRLARTKEGTQYLTYNQPKQRPLQKMKLTLTPAGEEIMSKTMIIRLRTKGQEPGPLPRPRTGIDIPLDILNALDLSDTPMTPEEIVKDVVTTNRLYPHPEKPTEGLVRRALRDLFEAGYIGKANE